MALRCAADDATLEGKGGNLEFDSKIKAICALYPPTLVREEVPEGKLNAFALLMGDMASSDDYVKASPIKQDLSSFPPCLLIHGSEDKVVPLSESENFYEGLQKFNRTAEIHIYADEENLRLIKIGSVTYFEGDFLRPDLRLERITSEGVILNISNRMFSLNIKDTWNL